MRDFEWNDHLWCVVKDDGTFAGKPCLAWEEAREIQAQHEGAHIYELILDEDQKQSSFLPGQVSHD